MHPARFVTLLYAYCGAVLVIQYLVVSPFSLATGDAWPAVAGVVLWGIAYNRSRQSLEELRPSSYGWVAGLLTLFALVLTLVTVGYVVLG